MVQGQLKSQFHKLNKCALKNATKIFSSFCFKIILKIRGGKPSNSGLITTVINMAQSKFLLIFFLLLAIYFQHDNI